VTPELSRADLLRLLTNTPQRGHSASAAVLGWACDENRRIRPPSISAGVAGESDREKVQAAPHGPVRYLACRRLRYWRVVECQPLAEREDIEEGERAPGLAPANGATPPPQDQAIAPLLSPGQWQNLWDRLPPRRCSARAIDVERSVAKLARAPIAAQSPARLQSRRHPDPGPPPGPAPGVGRYAYSQAQPASPAGRRCRAFTCPPGRTPRRS
jgi:hypothetical protein